jgi:hypothetical protein
VSLLSLFSLSLVSVLCLFRETPEKTIMPPRFFVSSCPFGAFLSLHALLALFCLFKLVREQIPNHFQNR